MYFTEYSITHNNILLSDSSLCSSSDVYLSKNNIESISTSREFSVKECCLGCIFCIPCCIASAVMHCKSSNCCCGHVIRISTVSGKEYSTTDHNSHQIINWFKQGSYVAPLQQQMQHTL